LRAEAKELRIMSAQHTSATPAKPSPEQIFYTVQGYQRAFALKAAVDIDLFTAIAKGNNTAAEIARSCNGAERGVRILCDAMTVMGMLTKSGDRYSLTGAADDKGTLAPDDPIWVEFARGMAPMMMPAAQAIAGILAQELGSRPSAKILDIAASHGLFGITVAKQLPNAHIYALDWAIVLKVAQENAGKEGVAERYHLLPGSVFDVDFGSGFDAVLITNLLHHFTPADNEKMLKKAHAALNPGGQVIVLEFVPNDDRISPPVPAMFSLTMLGSTPHGDAYTLAEYGTMFRNAGFEAPRLIPLEPMPQSLVVARKAF
jgi:precorrin-6B methylase 2